jgi:hypothetical protein
LSFFFFFFETGFCYIGQVFSTGWPWTHSPPASAFQVLELQTRITMSGLLCFKGSLYILDNRTLSKMWFANICFLHMAYIFYH